MKHSQHWLAVLLLVVAPSMAAAAPRSDALAPRAIRELPGKPTGPIVVDYRLATAPAVGVPLAITINARVQSGAALRLEVTASDPSSVLVTVPVLAASDAAQYSWQVTVVPLAAEAGYLNVIVAGDVEGVAQASAVTISLRSAPEAVPAAAQPPASSEALIALPVQETP
jgi:hypothetical protein